MAVISVALTLLLKYACLSVLPEEAMLSTLVLMGVLSRYSMVQLACFSPYARAEGGLGEPFVQGIKQKNFVIAVLITLGAALVFGGIPGMMIWMLVGLTTLSYQIYFRRRLQGITGDVLGAVNEANEALVLVLATMVY
jgi:adenosylcobinamide-GDP ribazoletransferase